mgnify:CR=1 FL=1
MINTETVTIDGREFTHTYSDTYLIRKVGTDEIYADAMDVLDYTYEETDIPLDVPASTPEEMREALRILGVQDMNINIIEQARKIRADMNAVTATLTDVQGLTVTEANDIEAARGK